MGARAKRSKGKHQPRPSHLLAPKKDHSDDAISSKRLLPSVSSSSISLNNAVSEQTSVDDALLGQPRYDRARRKSTFPPLGSIHGSIQQPTLLRINTLMSTEIDTRTENESRSPASESLRRLSLSKVSQEKSTLRRLSENLATTLDRVRQQLPPSIAPANNRTSSQTHNVADPGSTRRRSEELQASSFRQGTILENPVSIILRKASKAPGLLHSSSTPALSESDDAHRITEPRNSFSELISFRTTLLSPAAESPPKSRPENARTRSSTLTFSSSSGAGTPKALIKFDEASCKKSTPTASTALTFTDTHVAPGTFVLNAESQQASIISGSPSRRLSLVQIKSRDSVHEVIWSEGESRSDSGSSPSRPMSTTREEVEPLDHDEAPSRAQGNLLKNAAFGSDSQEHTHPYMARRVKTLSSLDQTLLQWVWHERPRGIEAEQESQPQRAPDSEFKVTTGSNGEDHSASAATGTAPRKRVSFSTTSGILERTPYSDSDYLVKTNERRASSQRSRLEEATQGGSGGGRIS